MNKILKWSLFILYCFVMATIDTFLIPTNWHYSFGYLAGGIGLLILIWDE